LDYMEGGGSDVVSLPVAKPVAPAKKKKEQPLWGVLLAVGVTLAALWLSTLPLWPFTMTVQGRATHPLEPVMFAIMLGMVVSNGWRCPSRCTPESNSPSKNSCRWALCCWARGWISP
jgi:hypothetical protein